MEIRNEKVFLPVATSGGTFNHYTLIYSSTLPLRACLTCVSDTGEVQEEFFLQAGEKMTFSSFIETYLNEGTYAHVVSLSVESIPNATGAPTEGDITVTSFCTGMSDEAPGGTYYFENERYRVGVELVWGGGLSCLIDKKCPVPGLGNLLNHFDTGRLVQQSYYGTSRPPYVCGEFMGNRWGYNPVQGGDKGNNKSRLIDFRVGESEVYVKCRPRDWGHDGGTTCAYMENVYRLEGDCLFVWNRFMDFSGWVHPMSKQELPAFYTVSYPGVYRYYDGDCPLDGMPLDPGVIGIATDLPFWPDDWPRCTFLQKQGNTMPFAAFTDEDGYGVGLFVPGTTAWLAGRFSYDGSKDPASGSTNYIAPTRELVLKSFKPLTYSYLICAGNMDDIAAAFIARRNDITNRELMEY